MLSILTPETIHRANSQFWEQMLGMSLAPDPTNQPQHSESTSLMGVCELNGAWVGSIQVWLSPGLALAATAAMLMQPPQAVQPDDILDAVKEIANMIAGTIKSALPRPTTMAVPHAELTRQSAPLPPDSLAVRFLHSSGEILVCVVPATTLAILHEVTLHTPPPTSNSSLPGLWQSTAQALA